TKNKMIAPVVELDDNSTFNKNGIVFYEKRNGVFLPSTPLFLDGNRIPSGGQLTRREELARFVTNHNNFPRTFVNRMWAHFFSRGMNVETGVDDFGEHNEVVHEELLNQLGEQFTRSGSYDPRKLIRWICASDAYNLKCVRNKTNDSPDAEVFSSRMLLKMM